MFLLISPSYSHRLGCAVTGYQRDEPGDVGVLQRGRDAKGGGKKTQFNDQTKIIFTRLLKELMLVFAKLTRMMMRIADTPEVAMTLAQLGMRLNKTGTMASAPWSNLFPSTVERWLQEYTQRNTQQICYDHRTQSKLWEKP